MSCLETLKQVGGILKTPSDVGLMGQASHSIEVIQTFGLGQLSPNKQSASFLEKNSRVGKLLTIPYVEEGSCIEQPMTPLSRAEPRTTKAI